ncbi:hypothetical protein M0805_000894 [Coniferiporia weirii]|nr:hypothetical protein M0805_000894 [Coniferiporia weirii]
MPVPATPAASQAQTGHALAVHRCRFVDYTPAAITAIAFPPLALPSLHTSRSARSKNAGARNRRRFGVLAVGRANGNIELSEWAAPAHEQEREAQSPQAWVLSKILHGPNPSKVDSLAFALKHPHLHAHNEVPDIDDLRLFSAGGGSELVEWDLATGTIVRTLNSQGGAIWSLAVNPANTLLALGCEDGCLRLLDVAGGALEHARRFDRVKCRVLSIAWGPPVPPSSSAQKQKGGETGNEEGESSESSDDDEDGEWSDEWLVTGGSDSSLRKWDVKTGRVLDRMGTDKVRGEQTLVWAVGALADGTIVSGDSLGIVKFWDSRTCTQLHSFSGHGADVLCLAIGPDGNSVFTSGVDQKVCLFTQVKFSNPDKTAKKGLRPTSRWVQSTSKRMHSHDVRALAVWPPYLPINTSTLRAPSFTSTPNPFAGIAPILASGGLDASLVLAPCASASAGPRILNPLATSAVTTFEDAYHRRVTYPTGLVPAVSVARAARLVVCTHETSVSVWRILGRARVASALEADLRAAEAMAVDNEDATGGEPTKRGPEGEDVECGYEKLLDMELDTTTNLCASAVSDDGRWLAVSDVYEVKLFELSSPSSDASGPLRPRRVKSLVSVLVQHLMPLEGASSLGFAPDSGRLVLAGTRSARVLIVDLTGRTDAGRPEPRVLRCFEHHAQRGAVFGRLVKEMPGRASVSREEGDANEGEGEDVEMGDGEVKEGAEGDPEEDDEESRALVTRMTFSPDGQWLATTDDRCRTHIFNLDAVQHHTALPTSPGRITAFAFSPSSSLSAHSSSSANATLLLMSHADATLAVFDVETRRFPSWAAHLTQRARLPRRWTGLHDSVLGVAIEPDAPPSSLPSANTPGSGGGRHALFWGATWLCRVTLDAPVGWGGFVKKRRRDAPAPAPPSVPGSKRGAPSGRTATDDGDGDEDEEGAEGDADADALSNFRLVTRYRPILRADFLGAGELLVVERPLVDMLSALPPAFFKPRYGS